MTFQTFTGREYLKIDIASNFGLDSADWNDRIDWFDKNQAALPYLVDQAKEPALFYAGIQAWNDVQQGKPIGYMISLDATSSGLQILAALTGDRFAAELCNVVDIGHRADAYTGVYQAMLAQTGGSAMISRDNVKEAVMTGLYGSTAVPERVFGEGELLAVFYDTMESLAPAAWELNEAMLQIWDSTAFEYNWVLPDNFHVHTKVMDTVREIVHFDNVPFEVTTKVNQPVKRGRSLGANLVHSIDGMMVREITRRCDFDPARIAYLNRVLGEPQSWGKQALTHDDQMVLTLWNHYQNSGYLSARILDHLNADNLGHVQHTVVEELLGSLPAKPFKVVSIHDCFRCLPHYGNDLRLQYNYQLALIAQSNLLQVLLSDIVGYSVTIGKLDHNMWQDIPATNYALS